MRSRIQQQEGNNLGIYTHSSMMIWLLLIACLAEVWATPDFTYRTTEPGTLTDICQWDIFGGRCENNEVVVMDRAEYGLLGTGSRCRTPSTAMTNTECRSDVLGQADYMCSGRQDCEIRVPNSEFESTNECFEVLRGYFQASYSCVPVLGSSVCSSPNPVIEVTSSQMHISSHHLRQSPCNGSYRRLTLTLTAKPGQQVNVTFTDFAWNIRNLQSEAENSYSSCISYGFVKDLQTGRREELCGGQQRYREVMLSLGSHVQVDLQPIPDNRLFMLNFNAVGCPDIVPPKDSWMNRSHDAVTVGCQNSGQTWSLQCRGGQWAGRPVGNCTGATQTLQKATPIAWQPLDLPDSIVIAIISAVAFLICVLITTIGVVCYKKASVKQEYYQGTLQMMKYNTARPTLRYTGTPPVQPRPPVRQGPPSESPYYSPAFPYNTNRTQRLPSQECPYESLHILDRPIPEDREDTETDPLTSTQHQARTLPVPGTSRATENPDVYSDSVASTSTEKPVKDPKYFVLDQTYIQRHNLDLQDD